MSAWLEEPTREEVGLTKLKVEEKERDCSTGAGPRVNEGGCWSEHTEAEAATFEGKRIEGGGEVDEGRDWASEGTGP